MCFHNDAAAMADAQSQAEAELAFVSTPTQGRCQGLGIWGLRFRDQAL